MSPVRGEIATWVGRLNGLPPCADDGVSGSPSVRSSFPSAVNCLAVMQVVGEPDRAVGTDGDAVRATDETLAPGALEGPATVEHDHGMRAAVEDPDVVVGVHGYGRRLHEAPSVGKRAPAHHRLVTHPWPPLATRALETRPYTATRP